MKRSILFVEENQGYRDAFIDVMATLAPDVVITWVRSVESALLVLSQRRFDVIISDEDLWMICERLGFEPRFLRDAQKMDFPYAH